MELATSIILSGAAAFYGYKKYLHVIDHIDNLGFKWTNDAMNMPSFANPAKVISGYTWSTPAQVAAFAVRNEVEAKKAGLPIVYIDEFRYNAQTVYKAKIDKRRKAKAESVKFYTSGLDLRKQILCIGSMSSGKTQFFLSIIEQNWYSRALIHDSKNEYSEYYLSSNGCYTLNIYDSRGYVWDILAEDNFDALMPLFITNLVEASMGKSGGSNDFFKTGAINRLKDMFIKVRVKYPDIKDSAKRWTLVMNELRTYINWVESQTQKSSEQDVKNSILLAVELLELMAYRIVKGNSGRFTVSGFFKNNGIKLFLAYGANRKGLEVYYSAIMAAFVTQHLSLPDQSKDYTMYLLDEYLTFKFDDETKENLHTMIRGKGGTVFMGMQFLPNQDEYLKDLIDSSRFALIFFSTDSEATKRHIINQIDQTSYEVKNTNVSTAGEHKTHSVNYAKDSIQVLTMDILNNPGPFYHITFIPKAQPKPILYLGYTQGVQLQKNAPTFTRYNLDDFQRMRLNVESVEGDTQVLDLEDVYKPISKRFKDFEKFDIFLKWSKAKTEEEKNTLLEQNNIASTDIEHLFEKYIRNGQIVDGKMKLYSQEQRLQIYIEWSTLQTPEEKYDFIDKYQLFGALPDFFQFDKAFIQKIRGVDHG